MQPPQLPLPTPLSSSVSVPVATPSTPSTPQAAPVLRDRKRAHDGRRRLPPLPQDRRVRPRHLSEAPLHTSPPPFPSSSSSAPSSQLPFPPSPLLLTLHLPAATPLPTPLLPPNHFPTSVVPAPPPPRRSSRRRQTPIAWWLPLPPPPPPPPPPSPSTGGIGRRGPHQ
jgi:hypothetical protein